DRTHRFQVQSEKPIEPSIARALEASAICIGHSRAFPAKRGAHFHTVESQISIGLQRFGQRTRAIDGCADVRADQSNPLPTVRRPQDNSHAMPLLAFGGLEFPSPPASLPARQRRAKRVTARPSPTTVPRRHIASHLTKRK